MLAIPVDVVVANSASIVSVQARKLIRSVAPPLPKKSIDFSGLPEISLCRFLRMSFFCACPGISPQRCSARSLRGGRGRVISHSDGHLVVRSALCPPNNQLEICFRFERISFCKFSVNEYGTIKRAGTQHIKSAGENLSPYL